VPVYKSKPTSPGRRFSIRISEPSLSREGPYKPLVAPLHRKGGRNNMGRITVRHRGGGHKQRYRLVDFKRTFDGIPATVERLEYDPNRTARIALIRYVNGRRSYILAPKGLKVGSQVSSGRNAPVRVGNNMALSDMPLGTVVHCVELKPGKGAQLARSAGTSAQLVAREGTYATLRLRSGEMRKVLSSCRATMGEVGNSEHSLQSLGKAGAKRWRGIRPTVRGVAMNPVDHPHGGGEGRTSGGRHPVSPTGVPAKGYKTRKTRRTDRYIVMHRKRRR